MPRPKTRREALKLFGRIAAAAPIAVAPLAVSEERLVMITGFEWISMRDELRKNFEFVKHGPLNIDAAYFRWVGA